MAKSSRNIVLLAGGVGGAKLAYGLSQVVPPEQLTIIGNTGDDFNHLGLHISPDLDTLLYTLAGVANEVTGWGRADESWRMMEQLKRLNGPDWFNLGDTDLATHLVRTNGLKAGLTLTQVTAQLCDSFGVRCTLLPMSDQPAPTMIETVDGRLLDFQTWFVREKWQPAVKRVILPDSAMATSSVIKALRRADVVIIAPSNPFVSIDPILNSYPIRPLLEDECEVVIAVSPIIAGEAVKGPTVKMMRDWEMPVSASKIALWYDSFITAFVYDVREQDDVRLSERLSVKLDSWMNHSADKVRLAQQILDVSEQLNHE